MPSVLADRTYRHLFCAQVIALVGTGLMTVALGLLAYKIVGDKAGAVLGTALAIKMVAYVGVAPSSAASRTCSHAAPSSSRWTLSAPPSHSPCPLWIGCGRSTY